MMPLNNLNLSLLYSNDISHDTWTFEELTRGRGNIKPDDLSPDSFYDVRGGLKASTDRIFTFLYTTDSFDLIEYVRFLLASLVDSQSMSPELEAFRNQKRGPPDMIAAVTNQDLGHLILRRTSQAWALDFVNPAGEAPDDRGSPFFRGVLIEPTAWQQAARIALKEYQTVLEESLTPSIQNHQGFLREVYEAIKVL